MKYILYIVVLFNFSLVACSGSNEGRNSFAAELYGQLWLMESYGIEGVNQSDLIEGTSYSLSFPENENTIDGGFNCNRFQSKYSLGEDKLVLESFAVTEIFCFSQSLNINAILVQNDFVHTVLGSEMTIEIIGDTLTLTSYDGQFLMFERE